VLSVLLDDCAVVAPLIMAGVLVLAFLALLNQALWFFAPHAKFDLPLDLQPSDRG
jgi:hypothetical protein